MLCPIASSKLPLSSLLYRVLMAWCLTLSHHYESPEDQGLQIILLSLVYPSGMKREKGRCPKMPKNLRSCQLPAAFAFACCCSDEGVIISSPLPPLPPNRPQSLPQYISTSQVKRCLKKNKQSKRTSLSFRRNGWLHL